MRRKSWSKWFFLIKAGQSWIDGVLFEALVNTPFPATPSRCESILESIVALYQEMLGGSGFGFADGSRKPIRNVRLFSLFENHAPVKFCGKWKDLSILKPHPKPAMPAIVSWASRWTQQCPQRPSLADREGWHYGRPKVPAAGGRGDIATTKWKNREKKMYQSVRKEHIHESMNYTAKSAIDSLYRYICIYIYI